VVSNGMTGSVVMPSYVDINLPSQTPLSPCPNRA
jgi:hypothetical protein